MAAEQPAGSSGAARRRRLSPRTLGALAVLALLGAVDLSRPPESQVSAAVLLGGIDLYQASLSKLLARGGAHCRFEPTCSHYGEAAIRKYGAAKGVALTARRILRCGPWTPAGTRDEP